MLHRSYTFGSSMHDRPFAEYKKYVFGSLLSFIINLSTYIILIEYWTIFWQYPILALISATAVSMHFSYLFMKKIVFLKK
jgi:putative flippase GtrA